MTQNAEQPIKIGIWGPSGVSKTSYLAAVYLEYQRAESGWEVQALNDEGYTSAHDFVQRIPAKLEIGEFPQSTLPEGRTLIRRYGLKFTRTAPPPRQGIRLRQKRDDLLPHVVSRSFTIDLLDVPGEFMTQLPPNVVDEPILQYFANLGECTGIILMIDPDIKEWAGGDQQTKHRYYTALEQLRIQLERSEVSGRKLALCMMKADRDAVQKYLSKGGTIADCIREHIGDTAYQIVQRMGQRSSSIVKHFAVSVAGLFTIPGADIQRPNVRYIPAINTEVIAYPDHRKPIGITGTAAPLSWILEYK